jgi:hypothetical protein
LFSWVDEIIRKTWREQHASSPQAKPSRPTAQRTAGREWVDRQSTAGHKVDPRRSRGSREAPLGNRSDGPWYGMNDQAPPQRAKRRRGPKQIDRAVAFLRRELAGGEVAAACLEEKAKTSGISSRTLDRARAQLKVISRRTGFARDGKCWLSLPRTS